MDEGFRCPRCGFRNPSITAVSDALLAIGGEREVASALRRIVEAARDLAGAEYAALGIPDELGGFADFITAGMSDETIDAIGRLPRTHGLLDVMLSDPAPLRTSNIQDDARFRGWPDAHPGMTSFLGVPVVSAGAVVAAFYLTNKRGAPAFTAADQEAVELLAAHAVVAIENARLYERSRELSIVEERNRLALELHDSVSQTLFSAVLTADAAATLIDRDPGEARTQIEHVQRLAREALHEMRSLIFELRPADIVREGLGETLRKHAEVLKRVYPAAVDVEVGAELPLAPRAQKELFRIAQEALSNALRHSGASRVCVRLDAGPAGARLSVSDDGHGFDPAAARPRRLGLTSMSERAASIGGRLEIDTTDGCGTTVVVELPDGR